MDDYSRLKDTLVRPGLSRRDITLILLAAHSRTATVSELVKLGKEAGVRSIAKWNLSTVLRRAVGLAILTPKGWEITAQGLRHLREAGLGEQPSPARQAAYDLRSHLPNIKSTETRAFVEEAVRCLEADLLRSGIVMSWIAAIDVLYKHVIENHLSPFNAEAKKVNPKWKPAVTADDLARMQESDFLDRISAISVIGKSTKDELKACLTLRNGCGHPNSLKVGRNRACSHVETLLKNVFEAFS